MKQHKTKQEKLEMSRDAGVWRRLIDRADSRRHL